VLKIQSTISKYSPKAKMGDSSPKFCIFRNKLAEKNDFFPEELKFKGIAPSPLPLRHGARQSWENAGNKFIRSLSLSFLPFSVTLFPPSKPFFFLPSPRVSG